MRKLFFLLSLAAVTILSSHAITINNTAGNLANLVQNTNITELTVTGTMDARDFLFITDKLNNLTSVNLGQAEIVAFDNGKALYGTIIHYPVNEIPRTAFFGKKLTSVTLPANLQSIGYAAFAGCDRLRSITLPASVTNIGDYAFAGSGLTQIELSAAIESMGKGVFSRCEALTSAIIDAAYIGDFAFLGDFNLTRVSIGKNVDNIYKGAFNGCLSLKKVDIAPGARMYRIDDEAFINSGLESIQIKYLRLATVGDWTFAQTHLSSLELSDGMTRLGVGALAHNPLLTSVILPKPATAGPSSHGNDFERANTRFNAPMQRPNPTIAVINDYTFAGDELLNASRVLKKGVGYVGNYAFYNVCQEMDTMFLPSTLTGLGDYAMAGMTGMKVLKTDAVEVPSVGVDVWAGVDQASIPLIAPNDQSLELYKVADQWMNFFYGSAIPDYILGDVNGDGIVSINDVTALINYLMNQTGNINMLAADLNEDGSVSIQDVTLLINKLMSGNAKMSLHRMRSVVESKFGPTSDVLVVPTVSIRAGQTRTIDVALNNTEHVYTALQCEVVMPLGLKLVAIEGVERGGAHNFRMLQHEQEDNIYSLTGLSMSLAPFAGNKGNVLRLTVMADDDFTAESAELTFANVVFATPKSESFVANDAIGKFTDATGIEDMTADRQVVDVRYINAAGQQSDRPFDGINIVVTTYTDGTTSTAKVIR